MIFFQRSWHENHSVNATFPRNLFIRTKKDPKFCPIFVLCRQYVGTLQALEYSGSEKASSFQPLKAREHLKALKAVKKLEDVRNSRT